MSSIFDGDQPVTERVCQPRREDLKDAIKSLGDRFGTAKWIVGILLTIFGLVVALIVMIETYTLDQSSRAIDGMRNATAEFRVETTRATEADKSRAETLAEIKASVKQLQDNQQTFIRTQERLSLNQERMLKIIDNGRGPGSE